MYTKQHKASNIFKNLYYIQKEHGHVIQLDHVAFLNMYVHS